MRRIKQTHYAVKRDQTPKSGDNNEKVSEVVCRVLPKIRDFFVNRPGASRPKTDQKPKPTQPFKASLMLDSILLNILASGFVVLKIQFTFILLNITFNNSFISFLEYV